MVMLTPDEDHYVHDPGMYVELHLAGPRGGIPAHFRKRVDARLIRFEGPYDVDQLQGIFAEGVKITKFVGGRWRRWWPRSWYEAAWPRSWRSWSCFESGVDERAVAFEG